MPGDPKEGGHQQGLPASLHLTCLCRTAQRRPDHPPQELRPRKQSPPARGNGREAWESAPLWGPSFPTGRQDATLNELGATWRVQGETRGPWHPADPQRCSQRGTRISSAPHVSCVNGVGLPLPGLSFPSSRGSKSCLALATQGRFTQKCWALGSRAEDSEALQPGPRAHSHSGLQSPRGHL